MKIILLIILGIYLNTTFAQTPLGTEFTYQGELNNANGNPHQGDFDFQFIAYDAQDDGSGNDLGTSLADDVTVNNGIFTTQIDFGDSAFVGDKVWLEISVRNGASTGDYTKLLPRQQITVAPYATHAQFVGADAVSGTEIQDGSITSSELANNSVTTDKIVTNSITSDKIANNSISTSKLINLSVTNDKIADDSIDSEKVVDGSIKAVDVDNTQIQQRIGSSCDDGFYLNGINQDGSVLCKQLPIGLPFTLDNIGDTGSHTSLAIGTDGFPIISYWSETSGQLKAYKCSNVTCSEGTAYPLDSMGPAQTNQSATSIAIGTNGDPVISYWDSINNYLKFYRCQNSSCSAGTVSTLDDTGNVGGYPSIAIGSDNFPVISYFDSTNAELQFYKCHDSSCSSGLALKLDDMQSVGHNSITIGTDGNPVISYSDSTNIRLNVFKCDTLSCILGSGVTANTSSAYESSIAIGIDDNPIISFWKVPSSEIWVHKCSDPSCSTGTTVTIDSSGGGYNSIVIGTDGNPIIIYNSNGNLNSYKCSNISCSAGDPFTLDSLGSVGSYNSIAIGANGNPIISYYDSSNGDLKVYSCGDESCSQ